MYGIAKNIISGFTAASVSERRFHSHARRVVRQVCNKDSNCIDIGAGRGRLLNNILDHAPRGQHYVFEPNPRYRENLSHRFANYRCRILNHMVGNEVGTVRRSYKIEFTINQLGTENRGKITDTVEVELPLSPLDEIIPGDYSPSLIKIDGKEHDISSVLRGAQRLIGRAKPHILIYCGLDWKIDKETAGELYAILSSNGLRISTPERWAGNKPCFTREEFTYGCTLGRSRQYIAYP